MYRPYRVTRVERQAFQLSGDKLAQQLRRPAVVRQLSKDALSLHWAQAFAQVGKKEGN